MKKIVCISDTHGLHDQLEIPSCDLLIHTGDATNIGSEKEMRSFASWLNHQTQASSILYVPGNHDTIAETDFGLVRQMFDPRIAVITAGVVEIAGFKILGYSWTPEFCGWGFQGWDHDSDNPKFRDMRRDLNLVSEVDIIAAHGPMQGILSRNQYDEECGSIQLRRAWERIKPKLYVCGHIHESYGRFKVDSYRTVVNAALPFWNDEVSDCFLNQPVVVHL